MRSRLRTLMNTLKQAGVAYDEAEDSALVANPVSSAQHKAGSGGKRSLVAGGDFGSSGLSEIPEGTQADCPPEPAESDVEEVMAKYGYKKAGNIAPGETGVLLDTSKLKSLSTGLAKVSVSEGMQEDKMREASGCVAHRRVFYLTRIIERNSEAT